MIINKLVIIISSFNILSAIIPSHFNLLNSSQLSRFDHNSIRGKIANNAIIDIKSSNDTIYFFGTGSGLSYAEIQNNNTIDFGYFNISNFPRGGNPALAVYNTNIVVSGIIDTNTATGSEPMGTGISYSIDNGENWNFLNQPIDNIPQSSQYHTINWGNQKLQALAVTTEINNVSYDLAINGDYIYAASWAGGLRRYPIGMFEENENRKWQTIPLPRDKDLDLYCGQIDTSIYYLNPRDPSDGGFHNHKGFSVFVDDNTIWFGSAAGINKGIINGSCIDWIGHYTYLRNNISGNWVIGFTQQKFNEFTRNWAITWSAESKGEFNGLSYTDDGGSSWKTTQPSGSPEKIYNIYGDSSKIWAASESGLYVSGNGKHWEKYLRPIDKNTDEELLTESVMAVYFSTSFKYLWLGSQDGIAISENNGINWTVHRFWEPLTYNNKDRMFSVYPNPFLINDYNQVNDDGFVRFLFSNPNDYKGRIDIYDFAMAKVINLDNFHKINNESELIWNGRNEYGNKVANGVYFCRLSLNGEYYWTKLAVIN